MVVSRRTQGIWLCILGKRILCKYGGKGRKKSICQRPMSRFQQRKDKQIVQSECAKRWFEVQETVKGTRTPKNSRPTHGRKTQMKRDKDQSF